MTNKAKHTPRPWWVDPEYCDYTVVSKSKDLVDQCEIKVRLPWGQKETDSWDKKCKTISNLIAAALNKAEGKNGTN